MLNTVGGEEEEKAAEKHCAKGGKNLRNKSSKSKTSKCRDVSKMKFELKTFLDD